MNPKRVGVLRGGSVDYDSSFKKGGEIILHILENLLHKYRPIDILVDKNGIWHAGGVPIELADIPDKVDLIWDASHPDSLLDTSDINVPKINTNSFSSSLNNNKDMLREHVQKIGINMPRHIVFPVYQKDFDGSEVSYAIKKAKEVFEKFSSPWIVRSFTQDSNIGIHLAKTFDELIYGIEDGVRHGKSILVEEFISGKPVAMHSVSDFRGEDVYVFPPAGFNSLEKEVVINAIKDLHKHLAVEYYIKSDIVFHPKKGIFLLGTDLSLDARKGSPFEQSCEYVGAKVHHVIRHVLDNALESK